MARSPYRRRRGAGPAAPRLAGAALAAALLAGCNAMPTPPPPRGFDGPVQVTVQAGDDVATIARRYNVTVDTLARANGLQPPYSVPPGTVLTVPRPGLHVVQPGESLYTIAQRYGVDVAALARANTIGQPYAIYVGETLRLPTGAAAGPVTASTPSGTAGGPRVIAGPGRTGTAPSSAAVEVESLGDLPGQPAPDPAGTDTTGEPGPDAPPALPAELGPDVERERAEDGGTLAAGTATVAAASAAGLDTVPVPPGRAPVPTTRTGQPAAPTPPATPAAAPSPPATADGAPDPAPAAPAPAETVSPSEPETAGPETAAPAVAAGAPRFRWPVAGDLLSGFGPKPDGSQNDGINVAAPRGTPIVAAQNGVVAYVGDELAGFGNLVLLRHADGWVTAYAHADRVLVAVDEEVAIGQTIATVGSTGEVASPQLHFEIRRGTEPVDPAQYLAAR